MNLSQRKIGKIDLVMLTLACVVNLPGLAMLANNGYSIFFVLAVIAIIFFIPLILVCNELGMAWPGEGGMYEWIKTAFNSKAAFLASFVIAATLVMILPTFLAFSSGLFATAIGFVSLDHSVWYTFFFALGGIWLSLLTNWFGVRGSAHVAIISVILGYLLPVITLVVFALIWIISGHTIATPINYHNIFPSASIMDTFNLAGVLVLFISGFEVAGYFVNNLRKQEDFPKIMGIVGVMILALIIIGVVSLLIFRPLDTLNDKNALLNAYLSFTHYYHITWLSSILLILVCIGQLLIVCTLLLASIKMLVPACKDNILHPWLAHPNRYGVAYRMLILLAIIASVVATLYILLPSLNIAFEILFVIMAITATSRYLLVFGAAIKLRYSHREHLRPFRIPGGNLMVWVISLLGCAAIIFSMALSLIPIAGIHLSHWAYVTIVLVGCGIVFMIPILIVSMN